MKNLEANTILSESEVEEILLRADTPLFDTPSVRLSVAERDALCATVKALRAQVDRLNSFGEEMLSRLEVVAGIGKKADHGWYYVASRIEAKIAEVERERDRLRAELDERDKSAGLVAEALSNEASRRID